MIIMPVELSSVNTQAVAFNFTYGFSAAVR